MLDRRRWFVVAGGLGAGLLAVPGQALAGLFRKRCEPAPCCPPPCCPPATTQQAAQSPTPKTVYSIEITCPVDDNLTTYTNSGLRVTGRWAADGYGTLYVKCVVTYGGTDYPSDCVATYSNNTWEVVFSTALPDAMGNKATVTATLYSDNTCATANQLDSTQTSFKLGSGGTNCLPLPKS
jgi:hypothetical protein